jgi:hypothetical protein
VHIKAPDDKQPTIDALRALLERRDVDGRARQQIEQEIRTTSAGWKGERLRFPDPRTVRHAERRYVAVLAALHTTRIHDPT